MAKDKSNLTGQILGDYKILSQIGDGGMGTVYVAEHLQYGVKYALKVLPEELSRSESFVQRFRREAGVMASLKHPHIVEVHNMSQVGDTYFLVMDYIQGPNGKPWNLENEIERRKEKGETFTEQEIKDLAEQVSDAIAYAHGRGVIHRDVKPSNILLDEQGRVRVVDFGLAKVVGERYFVSRVQVGTPPGRKKEGIQERLMKTPTGAILGTFDFMSPEQKEGKESDERSDIFAFGVMLYCLLTGSKPSGLGKLPSILARGINRRWDTVVGKCLEPKPEDRFQDFGELQGALESVSTSRVRASFLAAGILTVLLAGVIWAALPSGMNLIDIPFLGPAPTPTSTPTPVPTVTPTPTPPPPTETPTPTPSGPRPRVEIRSQFPEGGIAYRDRSRITVDFFGEPVPGGAIQRYAWRIDGGEWRETTSQYVQLSQLDVGAHRFEVRAFDYERRSSPIAVREFAVLGNAPPVVAWVVPAGDAAQLQPGEALDVIAEAEDPEGDPVVEWWWSVGSTERRPVRTQGGRRGTHSWPSLAAGLQSLYVCAMDSAGSRSDWVKKEVIVRYHEPTPTPTKKPTPSPTRTPHPTRTPTPTPTIEAGEVRDILIPGTNVGIELVMVPSGSFLMGSLGTEEDRKDDEGPIRRVTVGAFWMGRYEVTQAQWTAVMGDNPSRFIAPDRPVENVSWNQCRTFIRRLNQLIGGGTLRLPTEAEWEYACRAGSTTSFFSGETISPNEANYDGNYRYGEGETGPYRRKTMPVGSFPSNAWGLHDMHGNVWEWCEDWHHNGYQGAPGDGDTWSNPPGNSRVLRGGSWLDVPGRLRSAARNWDFPDVRLSTIGFRLASDVRGWNESTKVSSRE